MKKDLYEKLYEEGLVSDASLGRLRKRYEPALFSLHWETRTLLYLGMLLMSTGLGILVYQNINTIGHQIILLVIAFISIGCFAYCTRHKPAFSRERVASPDSLFDYLLLLGCLTFVAFVGYLQFQYQVFSLRYGLATFVPMVVLFFVAYYFDHIGVLNMAIVNLGLWMGVSVTPNGLLALLDFNGETMLYVSLGLGMLLLVGAFATQVFNVKRHFRFSYQHYGVHVAYMALLGGYFYFGFGHGLALMAGLFVLSYYLYRDAYERKSFYFLILVVLYTYVAVSSLVVRGLIRIDGYTDGFIFMVMGSIYFMGSPIGVVLVLMELNKKLKAA